MRRNQIWRQNDCVHRRGDVRAQGAHGACRGRKWACIPDMRHLGRFSKAFACVQGGSAFRSCLRVRQDQSRGPCFSASHRRDVLVSLQMNRGQRFKSTANLTSSQVATSLQVKLELHFNRRADFTSSERRLPLWGCVLGASRTFVLKSSFGGSRFFVAGEAEASLFAFFGLDTGRLPVPGAAARETCPRSRSWIFTCGEVKIATSSFICGAWRF